jgi:hypothetical protein
MHFYPHTGIVVKITVRRNLQDHAIELDTVVIADSSVVLFAEDIQVIACPPYKHAACLLGRHSEFGAMSRHIDMRDVLIGLFHINDSCCGKFFDEAILMGFEGPLGTPRTFGK